VFAYFIQFYITRLCCYNVPIMKRGPKPFVSKVCPACGADKPRSEYYRKLKTVSHRCKPCTNAYSSARAPRYYGRYREGQNAWRLNRYARDASYRERIAAQKKTAYDRRKQAINEARRERWANDPHNPARLYFRRKDVKLCTPPWVSKDALLAVYAACPKGREVDHIIPIKGLIDGRRVCGLHVPWNLQYLTQTQNRKKKNRISERDISHF
jgi:5-methylcytosine-specific restriction endonuclease McrA